MKIEFDTSDPVELEKVRAVLKVLDEVDQLIPPDPQKLQAARRKPPRPTSRKPREPRDPGPDWDLLFYRFWDVVHAKIKRAKAEEAFRKAVRKVAKDGAGTIDQAADFITARMKAYAASPAGNPTDRSPTHPATWLNGGQYEDDPETWKKENGAQPQRRLNL